MNEQTETQSEHWSNRIEAALDRIEEKQNRYLEKQEDQGLRLCTVEVDLIQIKEEIVGIKGWKSGVDRGVWGLIACTFLNILAWIGGHLKFGGA